jgi:hypothetical protein
MAYTPPPFYLFGATQVTPGEVVITTSTTTTCLLGVTTEEQGVIVPTNEVPSYLIGPTSSYVGTITEQTSCVAAPVPCPPSPCPVLLGSDCVYYVGDNLINTGIDYRDTFTVALEKIDIAIAATAGLVYDISRTGANTTPNNLYDITLICIY